MNYKSHYPVLYREVVEAAKSCTQGPRNILDCTFGAGGHTSLLLDEFPDAKVVSVDQDPEALENGKLLLAKRNDVSRHQFFDGNFAEYESSEMFDFLIADLGVSSHHFDTDYRGFSFRHEGPLDMRMNPRAGMTAAELLSSWDEEDIANLIFEFGGERYSRKIAREICELRKKENIHSTKQIENLVFHLYPKSQRHGKAHPATRTFQALRIAVNRELDVLEVLVDRLDQLLATGGIAAIISFHSLEDRIVKHKFKSMAKLGFEIITKKPVEPTEREIKENKRSRSAKMRLIRKVSE